MLEIVIKEPRVLQITRNARVGFADKLGIAGGTIGLFTGLSLISVVETAYWLAKWIVERFNLLRTKNKKPANQTNLPIKREVAKAW